MKGGYATEEFYHVFTRSIARYTIFNSDSEFERMRKAMSFYRIKDIPFKLSRFIDRFDGDFKKAFGNHPHQIPNRENLVTIIAYCIMPTHIHFIMRPSIDNGISIYMGRILNSYCRYFNTKHRRKGPLWESKYKKVPIETDEQLLHLTRYIHLNPSTANLVDSPSEWVMSSYAEYVSPCNHDRISHHEKWIDLKPLDYKKFVEDRVSYQRDLAIIKSCLFD